MLARIYYNMFIIITYIDQRKRLKVNRKVGNQYIGYIMTRGMSGLIALGIKLRQACENDLTQFHAR